MALLFELVSSVVGLALKPVLLAKLSCQFGARSLYFVVQTWLELLRFALGLHFVMLWRLAIWIMALLSLPVRAFTALYRERLLEMQLHRLKNEMENVVLDCKELEEQLHVAIKERAMMKMMLMELEQEHDEAILKIEQLQGEVQDLKDESQRLKEVRGKSIWSYLDQDDMDNDSYVTGKSTWQPDCNKKQAITDIHNDDVLKEGSKFYGPSQLYITRVISKEGILARQREIAVSRSLFSVLLSLVVGIIVWEAEDPCMPLVIALSVVVTMSLLSALQLLTRVEHKPASESVALLSINWFILGTLAYPMLPRIARFLAPLALRFLQRTLKWLVSWLIA